MKHFKTQPELQSLVLGLTTRCNGICKFCARQYGWVDDKRIIDLDLDLIVVPFLSKIMHISMVGSLGDAMLHPNILEFLKMCVKDYPLVTINIFTNGSMNDEKFWKELGLISGDNIKVIFSIDGLEDTHHIHRGTDYNTVIRNLKTYTSNRGIATWQFITFEYNFNQIEEAAQLAKSYGCKDFNAIRSIVYDSEFPAPPGVISRNVMLGNLATGKVDCYWKGHSKVYISEYGEVHPCCHMAPYFRYGGYEDVRPIYLENKELINLNNYTYDEVKENEYLNYIYKNCNDIKQCNKICGFNRILRAYLESVKYYEFF